MSKINEALLRAVANDPDIANREYIAAALTLLDNLRKEYDEEVISHDIEEKAYSEKLRVCRGELSEAKKKVLYWHNELVELGLASGAAQDVAREMRVWALR